MTKCWSKVILNIHSIGQCVLSNYHLVRAEGEYMSPQFHQQHVAHGEFGVHKTITIGGWVTWLKFWLYVQKQCVNIYILSEVNKFQNAYIVNIYLWLKTIDPKLAKVAP